MAAKSGRAACNLALLIQREGAYEELTGDPADLILGERRGYSLLRQHLERRSGSGFLNDVLSQLRQGGLSTGTALVCAREVVNSPGVALMRRREDNLHEFLQASLVRGKDGTDTYFVSLRVATSASKPPEVVEVHTESLPVDIAEDACDVTEYLEMWWKEFNVREITLPELSKPKNLLWLGDPSVSGYIDVPADWQSQIRTVASVLGMRAQFITRTTQLRARGPQLRDTIDTKIRLRGWQSSQKVAHEKSDEVTELIVGTPGSSFSNLLTHTRQTLIPIALDMDIHSPHEKRELQPGEIVYHRKVGDSTKYDHFDEGSSKPCRCNKTFTPFKSAPKASGGMARRYTNFHDKDVQLKHCPRYPNCNMYAVERRGTGSDAD
ncbi:hypothetical protein F9278_31900 [Streptomyces phaeolivaceus]|uniref:Uncharacterized protein n=1 Tax=Streptomyces phaeolivaceus TaxID=2653200 RepID=A0A5P8KAD7_9ACTN|nr:hypothetical protein [Streptomyces phaeolivaceus]QFR00005.1 hypothetical protein F9278_31900 [Streptomyces phaeolivaceus]